MRELDDPLLSAVGTSNGHEPHEDVRRAISAAERPRRPAAANLHVATRRVLAEIRHAVHASPALSLILLLLALGLVPSMVWAAWPRDHHERARTPDPRYASQSGSAHRTRAAHIAARGDEDVDSAVEACGGIGLDHLAAKYGMEPDPERVARRYAREYEQAFRPRVRAGCLHGLVHGG
jgi:hypothetical protein